MNFITKSSVLKKNEAMKILSIETSCDETAICVLEAEGEVESPVFKILGNSLYSQVNTHREYGGVYPKLAKREHAKNLIPLLKNVLVEAYNSLSYDISYDKELWNEIEKILEREEGLFESFKKFLENVKNPGIEAIGVTAGPGLEPALWVGISCAKALGKLWNIPVIGTNHMEGHIASILVSNPDERDFQFPALSLLISGGHTELVKIASWGDYEVIGETRDDAVGEAFDKAARMMKLPYPGGPEISKLAAVAREKKYTHMAKLPRPMINSKDLNFSFSGLKTAVLYYLRDNIVDTEETRADLAREFEDAVIEVLLSKTRTALEDRDFKTLIIAGGVIANKKLRDDFMQLEREFPGLIVKVPEKSLSTDNAIMIACATYINICLFPDILTKSRGIIARGNLKLGVNTQ